jgi:SAM-dependent methyltransferase
MPHSSTERFSNRVADYIRYRPHYPSAVIDCLQTRCDFTPATVVADIGSGTGILTALLLRQGNTVYGVEPNRDMRTAGEQQLAEYARFHSLAGTAEATTLGDRSIDLITAAQAFHWFDLPATRREFQRILKPQGWVMLLWNARREDSTAFAQAYEQLLQRYGTDYAAINHKRIDTEALRPFFGGPFHTTTMDNQQQFDYAGVQGRLLSSSYTPAFGHPDHAPMLADLREIFDRHQVNGTVSFEYDTTLYYGHLQ